MFQEQHIEYKWKALVEKSNNVIVKRFNSDSRVYEIVNLNKANEIPGENDPQRMCCVLDALGQVHLV